MREPSSVAHPVLLLAEKSADDGDDVIQDFEAHERRADAETDLEHPRSFDGGFDRGQNRVEPTQKPGDCRSHIDENFGHLHTPFHIFIINKAVTKCNRFFNLFDFFFLICFRIA